MSRSIYELKFTHADVMQLFRVEGRGQEISLPNKRKRECWRLEPNLIICLDGIFIDTEYAAGVEMTPSERKSYMFHPSGDPRLPLIEFPCTLEELKEFINNDGEERIDPFDLIDVVVGKMDFVGEERKGSKITSVEEKCLTPPEEPVSEKTPLYTGHLMGVAIGVQHKYWKSLEKPLPKQSYIIQDLVSNHGLSKMQAQAIEIVACPIDRKR